MKQLPYRQIHIDFHTSPFIKGVGDKFDAEEFVSVLKEAHVNSINVFAKCHHGMYYYPTKIGTMHPELKFDLLGAQIDACRKNNIRPVIYTTVVWNEDWADRHPEWQQVNPEGILGLKPPFLSKHHGWKALCLNNREHIEYLKAEFAETYHAYKPDAYWIDIIVSNRCVCKTCMKEMKKLGLNPENIWDLAKHDRLAVINFMNEIYNYIKGLSEDLEIYFNSASNQMDQVDSPDYSTLQMRKPNSFLDIESLPSGIWGYAHFPITVNYLNRYDTQLVMMNGRFHKSWGDFGTLRNKEALEYECFRALANGAGCCVGDQLHPSGLIDKTIYKRIGEVYSEVKAKEKWCIGTKKNAQVGAYTCSTTFSFADSQAKEKQGQSNEGVYRIMSELKIQFDYIDFVTPLDKYELVILPDSITLPDSVAKALKEYINQGGKVLLTGESGLKENACEYALEEFGAKYIKPAEYNPRYIEVNTENFPEIPPMPYVVYEKGIEVEANSGADVLAYINNPQFNRTYDIFCSHRQTPPSDVTDKPCIIKGENAILIANPLFRDYAVNGNKVFKDIIAHCIALLMPEPLIKTDLPVSAEVTLRKKGRDDVLHILSYNITKKCREHDIIEERIVLFNKNVQVKSNTKPKDVFTLPDLNALTFEWDGKYVSFTVPVIDGHCMVKIEK